MLLRCAAVAIAVLIANGLLHGLWSHRWEKWSETDVQAQRIKGLENIKLDHWEGKPGDSESVKLAEEEVAFTTVVNYTNRFDGSVVTILLICGPTDAIVAHTPRVCFPANGFKCSASDLTVSVPGTGAPSKFWSSTFSKAETTVPLHLRVLWSWSDGSGWQIPDKPLRTFRRSPVLYKCYAWRQVSIPDEPIEGDPAVELLSELLPQLNPLLSSDQ